MICPMCGGDRFAVKETRSAEAGIVRRRLCLDCNNRFYTVERPTPAEDPAVVEVQKTTYERMAAARRTRAALKPKKRVTAPSWAGYDADQDDDDYLPDY